jgi:hypothetical protein
MRHVGEELGLVLAGDFELVALVDGLPKQVRRAICLSENSPISARVTVIAPSGTPLRKRGTASVFGKFSLNAPYFSSGSSRRSRT